MSDAYLPQRRSSGWSLFDVPLSPVFNILETASGLPGVRDTEFADWLYNAPLFQGAQEFQAAEPGWALGTDILASFVPFVGWGAAVNRARAGAGLLGAVQSGSVRAASLFPSSPTLAFAAGETVKYTPLAAALTGFDLAGGRYDNPMDALTNFALGTALGAGFQAGGHALSPLVRRAFPASAADIAAGRVDSIPASLWAAAFEPGPELSALYGFTDNTRRAAAAAARSPRVQEALDPTLEPQQVDRALEEIESEIQAEIAAGRTPEIDPQVIATQRDNARRAIVFQEPDPHQSVFDLNPEDGDAHEVVRNLNYAFRTGEHLGGRWATLPLTGSGDTATNPQVLMQTLDLHPNWLQDAKWPRLQRVVQKGSALWRRSFNLPDPNDPTLPQGPGIGRNFRRVNRVSPNGTLQTWSARREHTVRGDGLWIMTVQVPSDKPVRLNGEPALQFLQFKTDRPARFIPEAFLDTDNGGVNHMWYRRSNLDTTKSELLKQILDFEDIYLNPNTIKSTYRAMLGSPQAKREFVQKILAGPTKGQEIARLIERYAAPTIQQFKNSPEAQGIWGLYRAVMEGLEGRVRARLHGTAILGKDQSPIASIFGTPPVDDANALVPQLRQMVLDDPEQLEIIRKFIKRGGVKLDSIAHTPAGQWLAKAKQFNDEDIAQYNPAIDSLRKIGATDAQTITPRKDHIGVSRSWDGSIFVPVYKKNAINPEAVIAGNSRGQAEQKAKAWIAAASAEEPDAGWRAGETFIPGEAAETPRWLVKMHSNPKFLEPRRDMRGFEHEFEPYKHVDNFIAELEDNTVKRARYFGSVVGDALTVGKRNTLRTTDPHTWNILDTRIHQLLGRPLQFEEWQDRVMDSWLAPYLGTRSASKIADKLNQGMFHLLHGVGYLGTPVLNLTAILQTHLPAAVEALTSTPDELRHIAFQIPMFDAAGKPRPGFNWIADPIGLLWGGFKKASDPNDVDKEVFQVLFNRKIMGTGLANEYTGQDRTIAARMSEGVRGAEDIGFWADRLSSMFMTKTEQFTRTIAAGMALNAMERLERAWGIKFSMDQKIHNAANMVERANYGYFKQDRPLMYSSPLGTVFGNQKTWMTNYLFMMAHYTGLAAKGNFAPLLFSLGTTTALGGVFAIPLLGQGFDAVTEFFADKDGREFIYEQMGEGGNAVSFGLPALFGISVSGNVAAPGSNLAHDMEFMFSIMAFERAKLLGRAVGRAMDDQLALGINPLRDPVWRQQAAQALAPRSIYRTWEAIQSDSLRSAATGYPLVQNLGFGARFMHALGFRDVDVALQYETYASLLKDRDAMRRRVSLFGEAYARAALSNDRDMMQEVLQQAAVQGMDINSIMRSAQTRMRSAGADMFGRNFNQEQLERYQASLQASGAWQ